MKSRSQRGGGGGLTRGALYQDAVAGPDPPDFDEREVGRQVIDGEWGGQVEVDVVRDPKHVRLLRHHERAQRATLRAVDDHVVPALEMDKSDLLIVARLHRLSSLNGGEGRGTSTKTFHKVFCSPPPLPEIRGLLVLFSVFKLPKAP